MHPPSHYICIYIYIYIYIYMYRCNLSLSLYIYIYMYTYLVRHGNRQDICSWFPSSTSSIVFVFMFSVGFLFMVSVVAGNVFMVSVAGFSRDSAVAGGFIILESIEWFLVLGFLGLVSVAVFVFMVSVVAGKRCFMASVVACLMVSVVARNVLYGFRHFFLFGFRLLQDRGSLYDGNHF